MRALRQSTPWRRGFVLGAVGLCLSVMVAGCGESSKQRSEREAAERRKQARRQAITELARMYNADVAWSGHGRSFALTLDVQERLLRSDGRPIVGVAGLWDIERDGGSYLVSLSHGDLTDPSILFVLRYDQPDKLERPEKHWSWLSEKTTARFGPQYAFVAKIERVTLRDRLTSNGIVNHTRIGWVAQGSCLALRKVAMP